MTLGFNGTLTEVPKMVMIQNDEPRFGEISPPTLAIFYAIWANVRCCKWSSIENNLAIWSHW